MLFTKFKISFTQDIMYAAWDDPDRSMNIIDDVVMDELEQIVDMVNNDEYNVKGCILHSLKKDFSGGADLSMLQSLKSRYETYKEENGKDAANIWFMENTSRLSRILRKLELAKKPFVSALHGVCLGGAFEIALACHYRVMSPDRASKVGLPEVKLGMFPGAGGTMRVARLAPTDKALQFLLKGNFLTGDKAVKLGIVDDVAVNPLDAAKDWINTIGDPVARWDKKDFKNPSGKVFSPGGMMVWMPANAHYRKETFDNYPGARAILTGVYEGLQVPMNTALRIESRLFANVVRTKEAEAMIGTLFLAKNELEKGARRPDLPQTTIRRIGVIGAGLMGSGIAHAAASNGVDVVLVDINQEAADRGKDNINKLLTGLVQKGRLTDEKRIDILNSVNPTANFNDLAGVDLVIEAVFEERGVKIDTQKKVQAVVPNVIFASNTSTLPITSLAETVVDPTRFVGIHFFSPVDKMMLVEIIRGEKTGDEALATALDFVRIIKKTPIVVNDGRGFFANRCVLAYVREGHLMLHEGVPAALIENAARMAGMPVGPLALNDEVGLDLGWKILQATKKDLGVSSIDPIQEKILRRLVEVNGRFGRKNGSGFYDYENGKKKLWSGLKEYALNEEFDVEELKRRFLFVQSIEALRTVEEGIVTDDREADVGSIFGFGFPPFTGGVLSYVKQMGKAQFESIAKELEIKHGERFRLPNKV